MTTPSTHLEPAADACAWPVGPLSPPDALPADRPRRGRTVGLGVLAASAVFLVELVTVFGAVNVSGDLNAVWPSAGVGMAIILMFGPRFAVPIYLGAALRSWFTGWAFFGHDVLDGGNIAWGVLTPLPNVACYLAAYWLIRSKSDAWPPFENTRDTMRFLICACIWLPAIAGATEIGMGVAMNRVQPAQTLPAFATWYFAEVIGIGFVCPLLLALASKPHRQRFGAAWPMALTASAFTCLAVSIAFSAFGQKLPGLAITALAAWAPLVSWSAVAGGLLSGSLVLAGGGAIAIWCLSSGPGPFPVDNQTQKLACLQAYMAMLTASMLITASVSAERQHEQTKLQRSRDEATRAHARIRRLSQRMAEAEDLRNRQIAEALHDGLGQDLAMVQTELTKTLAQETQVDPKALVYLKQAIGKTRQVVFELSPPTLAKLGLTPALRSLAGMTEAQHDVVVQVQTQIATAAASPTDPAAETQSPRLANNIEAFVFRAAREMMINALKHAQPGIIDLRLRFEDRAVELTVEDDGPGFDLEACLLDDTIESGFGLMSIREFARTHGGDLQQPAAGTATLTLRLPVETRTPPTAH